ncbi:MAG: His/Gly/Thr/Pro-type tRNA ligase C-terminal domain-containing protein, partial [Candidatus Paceibacterota bacterium]
SLSTQLRDAEALQVKHTIIIGQKEYVDGTVIMRDMMARNQEPISIDAIVPYLKRVHTQRVLR